MRICEAVCWRPGYPGVRCSNEEGCAFRRLEETNLSPYSILSGTEHIPGANVVTREGACSEETLSWQVQDAITNPPRVFRAGNRDPDDITRIF